MRAAHAAIDARDAGLEARLHARFEGQLAELRAQVATLQARLEPTKPTAPPAKKPHDNTALEPLSYDAAFEQLGGQKALDQYAARSKALIERTRDDALEKELADLQMTERRGFSTALVNQRFVEDLDELYDWLIGACGVSDALAEVRSRAARIAASMQSGVKSYRLLGRVRFSTKF